MDSSGGTHQTVPLDMRNLSLGRRNLVNAYEVKAGIGVIAGNIVWSMPERLECEVLQKARYINTLTFTFYLYKTHSTAFRTSTIQFHFVGWKHCSYFWCRKINLYGISQAKRSRSGPNSVYVETWRGDNVQGILGAIGPFWAKWGLGQVPRSPRFCVW